MYHSLLQLNVKKEQNSHQVVYMDGELSPVVAVSDITWMSD